MRLTIEAYGAKYMIETEFDDIEMEELYLLFQRITLCAGYDSKTVDEFFKGEDMKDKYIEVLESMRKHCYSVDRKPENDALSHAISAIEENGKLKNSAQYRRVEMQQAEIIKLEEERDRYKRVYDKWGETSPHVLTDTNIREYYIHQMLLYENERAELKAQLTTLREAVEKFEQLVIEDVPHKYQDRLLDKIKVIK